LTELSTDANGLGLGSGEVGVDGAVDGLAGVMQ